MAQIGNFAPAIAGPENAEWARKAENLMPRLNRSESAPLGLVKPVADPAFPLRYRMEQVAQSTPFERQTWRKGDSFIVDFGGHRTGYLKFRLQTEGTEPDAPARLKLTFGEVPTDVAEPLHPYKGILSESWLPEEIITIDYLPQEVQLPRRYAFRYVKIEVIDTSPAFGIRFEGMQAIAVTSAGPMPAPQGDTPLLRRIDEVSMATLRDCMQTSFEDGPRRDQRLWLGDLRLQALANYATFDNRDLVKRCLYLFAAYRDRDGLAAACVYEKPTARYGGVHIVDYAALFNVTLRDYVNQTGDKALARELWPVAWRQIELISRWIRADGLFIDPGNMWIFIDWSDKLDKNAAIQGLLTFAWKATAELADMAGEPARAKDLRKRAAMMTTAGRKAYFRHGTVRSGAKGQISYAGAAWFTLGGLLSDQEAARALDLAMTEPASIKPVTPYLYHYMVEALLQCGQVRAARELLESYWGGMVKAGADTFWEIYDPENPMESPYKDIHINSFCHAWSCTPSYLIRTRGLGRGA